ncbi:hypothetical protein DMENIID0001_108910 [Sergentomyia squamirostris]
MERDVIVIDGGFATQLTRHVEDMVDGDPLWSSRFNCTNPEIVKLVHGHFLDAGSEIIRTNTYQASIEGYMSHLGLTQEEAENLIRKTVNLTLESRADFQGKSPKCRDIKVFGSIGPYGAYLADGSEYSGNYIKTISHDVIREWHKRRITIVVEAGVDGLAVETIPSAIEGEIIVDLLQKDFPGVKFWLSFQCRNGSETAAGEKYQDAVRKIWKKTENILAIGVNCLHPDYVASLFAGLNDPEGDKKTWIPLIAYPNSGETYDVINKKWISDRSLRPLETYIEEWIRLGVRYIGGCCRNYAENISRLRETLDTLSLSHNNNK